MTYDFSNMVHDPTKGVKYRELEEEVFQKPIDDWDNEKVLKYVILFVALDSPLWSVKDYEQRKKEALRLAGFSAKDLAYQIILMDNSPEVIEKEVAYAFISGGTDLTMYVSCQKYFMEANNKVAQPIRRALDEDKELKCYQIKSNLLEDLDSLRKRLKDLETALFPDTKMKGKVLKMKNGHSAESFAKTGSVR